MDYKVKCPDCGTRLSRWRYFSSLSVYYRCQKCAARYRMTARGFAITLAAACVPLVWAALDLLDVISWYVAVDFLVLTCGLCIWLLPFWTPVRAERPARSDKP
jgi:DNA-directed RNA polymerase subunit RPC12/RpoP